MKSEELQPLLDRLIAEWENEFVPEKLPDGSSLQRIKKYKKE